jgi:hypothetical protein
MDPKNLNKQTPPCPQKSTQNFLLLESKILQQRKVNGNDAIHPSKVVFFTRTQCRQQQKGSLCLPLEKLNEHDAQTEAVRRRGVSSRRHDHMLR